MKIELTREEAKQWIENLIYTMKDETSGNFPDVAYKDEVYVALDMAIKEFKQKPKKGHWVKEVIETENDGIRISYKCSECEVNQPFEENFCPNCGVKMESESK